MSDHEYNKWFPIMNPLALRGIIFGAVVFIIISMLPIGAIGLTLGKLGAFLGCFVLALHEHSRVEKKPEWYIPLLLICLVFNPFISVATHLPILWRLSQIAAIGIVGGYYFTINSR